MNRGRSSSRSLIVTATVELAVTVLAVIQCEWTLPFAVIHFGGRLCRMSLALPRSTHEPTKMSTIQPGTRRPNFHEKPQAPDLALWRRTRSRFAQVAVQNRCRGSITTNGVEQASHDVNMAPSLRCVANCM